MSFPDLPLPTVTFTVSDEEAVAGQNYVLTCSAEVVENLVNSAAINVQWLDSMGSPVSGNGITVGNAVKSGTMTTRELPLNPLRNSHFGCYTCRGCITVDKASITDHCNQIVLPIASERKNITSQKFSE